MPENYRQLPPLGDLPPDKDPKTLDDIDRLMESVGRAKKRVPHIIEIIEYLIEEWGGARKFARAYYEEYKKSGSIHFKGRMLESIIRLMQVHAAQVGPQEEMSSLTDKELQSVAVSLLGPFYAKQKESDLRPHQRPAADQEAAEGEGEATLQSASSSPALPDQPASGRRYWGPPLRDKDSRPSPS